MKRTEFITPAMKELLIPSEGFCNLFPFPEGLVGLQKGDKSFFELQTFPHVGDMVAGLEEGEEGFTLFKVKQIIWTRNNEIRVAQDAGGKRVTLLPSYIQSVSQMKC